MNSIKMSLPQVPLGDDFTYAKGIEWDAQYSNYKSIIDYINSNPEYNAHVRLARGIELLRLNKNTFDLQ